MKKLLFIIITVVLANLTGCASIQESIEAQNNLIMDAKSSFLRSYEKAIYVCKNPSNCNKAFKLTSVFIANNSDTKIQFANDAVINTYNPIQIENMSINATREPIDNQFEKIQLSIICKEPQQMSGILLESYIRCLRRGASKFDEFVEYLNKK